MGLISYENVKLMLEGLIHGFPKALRDNEATADDALDMLAESGIIEPVSDADGRLLTDNVGNIYVL